MADVRILVIEHEKGTGPERFGQWLEEAGAEVVVVRPYLGEAIPAPEPRERPAVEPVDDGAGASGRFGDYAALLVLGGAAGPLEDTANPWFPQVRELLQRSADGEFPSFNVCLGGELLAAATDARISRRERPQIGIYDLRTTSAGESDPVFAALAGRTLPSVLFHQEEMSLPEGAELLVTGSDAPVQGFRVGEFAWGTQFHPETDAVQIARWLSSDSVPLPEGKTAESIVEEVRAADAELIAWGRELAQRFVEYLRRREGRNGAGADDVNLTTS
ncbi:type 1 glutamine amidotransferase [Brevibacterium casei]|uniref:type 1 glutamine amidotransferase n=1 Tax=Brevibacterium casei TaxID=33889 RepID=UPI00344C029B